MRPFALIALGSVLALALPAFADATASALVSEIRARIDFSKPGEPLTSAVEALNGALGAAPPAFWLDLEIRPAAAMGEPDPRFTITGGSGPSMDTKPFVCDGHGLARIEALRLSLAFNPDYNHLLLDVLLPDPLRHPANAIACEYRADAVETPVLAIRGYYTAVIVGIPTANAVELRPVSASEALALVAARPGKP